MVDAGDDLSTKKSSVLQSSFCCAFALVIVTEKMLQIVLILFPLVLIDPVPAIANGMTDGMRLVSQSSAFFTADLYGVSFSWNYWPIPRIF